jgi:hypothetical protein
LKKKRRVDLLVSWLPSRLVQRGLFWSVSYSYSTYSDSWRHNLVLW